MKFMFAAPPTQPLEISSPQALRFPPMMVISLAGVLVGLAMLGVAAAMLLMAGQLDVLMHQFKLALDTQPPLVFIGSLFLVLAVHEAVHCIFFPGPITSERKVLGILPKTGLAYAWCGLPMRRNRYLLVALAPTFFLSILPLVFFSSFPTDIGPLLPMALFNVLGAGGDAMVVYFVLRQVPRNGWVQLSGGSSFWGGYAPGATVAPTLDIEMLPD
jgi:hypothetical protein